MILHRFLEALKTMICFVEGLNFSVSTIDNQNVLGRFVILVERVADFGFDDIVDLLC
mgnify:CR=1 FL=1